MSAPCEGARPCCEHEQACPGLPCSPNTAFFVYIPEIHDEPPESASHLQLSRSPTPARRRDGENLRGSRGAIVFTAPEESCSSAAVDSLAPSSYNRKTLIHRRLGTVSVISWCRLQLAMVLSGQGDKQRGSYPWHAQPLWRSKSAMGPMQARKIYPPLPTPFRVV